MADQASYLKALRTKEKYEKELLLLPGVAGCGIRVTREDSLGIVVYITGKAEDIPSDLEEVTVLTEEIAPDEHWAESGHVTAADPLERDRRNQKHAHASTLNVVDCAVGDPVSIDYFVPEILGLGVPRGVRQPRLGMRVKKSGRTTGVTQGAINACGVSIWVTFPGFGTTLFVDQIATTPMAEPGDSGSLTVDEDLHAVGLLFAQTKTATFHNKIQNVLSALDLDIWTGPITPELSSRIEQTRKQYEEGKARTSRWRRMPGGVSIGHARGSTGTAGCYVKSRKSGAVLILSNAHVLAMPTR